MTDNRPTDLSGQIPAELFQRFLYGDGKPQAFNCASDFLFGVDSQNVTFGIDQGPAAISRVDLGIGLNETAFVSREDPRGDRISQLGRIADSIYLIALGQLIGLARNQRRRLVAIHFQQGQVVFLTDSHQAGIQFRVVYQHHGEALGEIRHGAAVVVVPASRFIFIQLGFELFFSFLVIGLPVVILPFTVLVLTPRRESIGGRFHAWLF